MLIIFYPFMCVANLVYYIAYQHFRVYHLLFDTCK